MQSCWELCSWIWGPLFEGDPIAWRWWRRWRGHSARLQTEGRQTCYNLDWFLWFYCIQIHSESFFIIPTPTKLAQWYHAPEWRTNELIINLSSYSYLWTVWTKLKEIGRIWQYSTLPTRNTVLSALSKIRCKIRPLKHRRIIIVNCKTHKTNYSNLIEELFWPCIDKDCDFSEVYSSVFQIKHLRRSILFSLVLWKKLLKYQFGVFFFNKKSYNTLLVKCWGVCKWLEKNITDLYCLCYL